MTQTPRGPGRAVAWVSASQIGRIVLQILSVSVLAHLLSPSDFGLMAMALVATGFIGIFKDLGIGAAIVRSRSTELSALSSLFWTVVVFTAALALVLVAAAPILGALFSEVRVVDLTRVTAVGIVAAGIGIVPKATLERDLRFRPVAVAELSGAALGAAAGIVMAVSHAGVWSLVGQYLVGAFATSLAVWRVSAFRPQLMWRAGDATTAVKFGLGLYGFNVVNYFARNADNLLLGIYAGSSQLGPYSLSYSLMMLPIQAVSQVAGRVLFPTLTLHRDNLDDLRARYLNAVSLTATLAFPMSAGLGLTAATLVPVMFGPHWTEAIALVQLLSVVALQQSIGFLVGSIYLAMGRTRLMFAWGIASSSLVVLGFVVGLRWGALGVAASYLATTSILAVPLHAIPLRLIGLRLTSLVTAVLRPAACTGVMAIAVSGITWRVAPYLADIALFACQILVGIVSYVAASLLINRTTFRSLRVSLS